jgi:hypothetical protein
MVLCIGGLAAGTLGGLLGIGGGILIMPLLRFVMKLPPAHAAGICIVAVFFTTIGGSIKHFKLGHIELRSILSVMITGFFSTIIFSFVFVYVSGKDKWLDLGMGIVFSVVALRMLWEGIDDALQKSVHPRTGKGVPGSISTKMFIGGFAGVLPGLLGIGTGAVLVPAFAIVLNAPIKVAIGSSLACFSLNALVSSLFKLSQGYVRFSFLIPLCLGTFLGSRFGATLNGRFSSGVLKIFFGLVFVYVALKYIFLF